VTIVAGRPNSSSQCPSRCDVTRLQLSIDPVACDAYGYCAELLPEAITLDEWGYPMLDGKSLPPELLALARRAARDCPRRAVTLRETKRPD
jgi:ferredoxin